MRKTVRYGLVVLTSRAIGENDLFAKLVDTGLTIGSVDDALALLESFLKNVKEMKIGGVVEVETLGQEMRLTVVAKSPSGFGK